MLRSVCQVVGLDPPVVLGLLTGNVILAPLFFSGFLYFPLMAGMSTWFCMMLLISSSLLNLPRDWGEPGKSWSEEIMRHERGLALGTGALVFLTGGASLVIAFYIVPEARDYALVLLGALAFVAGLSGLIGWWRARDPW